MPRAPAWLCTTLLALACVGLPVNAAVAQPAPEPASQPDPDPDPDADSDPDADPDPDVNGPPALSPEDVRALERALAADAADTEDAPATEDDTAGAAPSRGVQSMNPDISAIADFALAYFSEDENLQTGAHDPIDTGFNLQQLELSIASAVDPYFRFDANIVFALFGVEIEEAYATTLDLPARLQVRAGQFLTRFGRINALHPHSWDFVDQPFAIGRVFGAEGNRGLGVELSWLTPLPWYVELVGSVTDAAGEATARSFYGANDLGVDRVTDFEFMGAVKQFVPLSENWSLATGLSSASGPNATGRDNRTEIYGADLYLKWRPITYQSNEAVALHTEWFYRRRQVPDAVLQDVSGFAALLWRFAMRWAAGARYELGSPAVDADFDVAADYLDPEWTENRQRVTANATFFPTEFSRIRLQASADLPRFRDESIYAVFVAFEVVTGAHGAHPF